MISKTQLTNIFCSHVSDIGQDPVAPFFASGAATAESFLKLNPNKYIMDLGYGPQTTKQLAANSATKLQPVINADSYAWFVTVSFNAHGCS